MSKLLKPHVCVKSFWLCRTLCDPVDYSLPGPSVHGILQARMLEWLAISFSRGSSWPRDRTRFSYASWVGRWVFTTLPPGRPSESRAVALSPSGVSDSATPWAVVRQAPLSIGVPTQECWSELPWPLQGVFPTQGLNQVSHLAGGFFTVWAARGAQEYWRGRILLILAPGHFWSLIYTRNFPGWSSDTFFCFLVNLLLYLTSLRAQAVAMLNIVFNKPFLGQFSLVNDCCTGSNKGKPCEWCFPRVLPDKLNNTSLGMGLLEAPKCLPSPVCLLLEAAGLLAFTVTVAVTLLFQGLCGSGRRECEQSKLKCYKSHR